MQNSVLTTEGVKELIDNLYKTIGVRMNVNLSKYPNVNSHHSVNQSSFLDDCKIITDHLELPISIKPIFSSSFETKGIVHNEKNGTSGIGAQIHIPGNLPWYKTEAMNNFPINITVPPDALAQGHYYLMTQLSHEFSHIYLHSRKDPQRESEWATDLCALMMGFSSLWLQGRKLTIKQENSIQTFTNGYLSDAEFDFAVYYINNLRRPFEDVRNGISSLKQRIQLDYDEVSIYLKDVYLLYDFHFKHAQKSFKHIKDVAVFSKLAQSQYKTDIETLLLKSKKDTNAIVKPLQNKKEFYEKDVALMENDLERLNAIEEKLVQRLKELKDDYEIIFRNIDVEHYTKIFDSRVESMSKGLRMANKIMRAIYQRITVLEKCLTFYKQYKKNSYLNKTDAKTFSLISNTDYIASSIAFLKRKQEKIDEIDSILKTAQCFYSIDDEILLSKIAELNELVPTLQYCLEEQKSHIKVVKRNLTFIGKIKWLFNSF